MYNNSSNWPCHNHIITVLGKSKVYSTKVKSLFSRKLVCKNIKTVIYKIQMQMSVLQLSLDAAQANWARRVIHIIFFCYLLTSMSGDFSSDINNYQCSVVQDVPLV